MVKYFVPQAILVFQSFCLTVYGRREANRVAGTSSSTTEELDEYDQMDAEEREEATSGTSHTVSWKKAWAYLCAVIKAR